MIKVGVIGAGAWGSALAILSKKAGNFVVLWSFDGVASCGFDGQITTNLADLQNMDIWLVATPSDFFNETLQKCRPFYKNQPIIICTKGMKDGRFISQVLTKAIPNAKYGILSGPQFAAEVAKGIPTGSTIAGDKTICTAAKMALPTLYLEETNDIIGTEFCGTGKNAVAIIAGFYSIKAGGENEFAMNLARAWGEVVSIGVATGANPRTFSMLCGVGDLFLTATSKTSRNFSAGAAIANGQKPMGTVEGISALNALTAMAKDLNIDTPMLSEMKELI